MQRKAVHDIKVAGLTIPPATQRAAIEKISGREFFSRQHLSDALGSCGVPEYVLYKRKVDFRHGHHGNTLPCLTYATTRLLEHLREIGAIQYVGGRLWAWRDGHAGDHMSNDRRSSTPGIRKHSLNPPAI